MEYALIIAGVAAVLAVVVFALEDVLRGMFEDTCEKITTTADDCDGKPPATDTP